MQIQLFAAVRGRIPQYTQHQQRQQRQQHKQRNFFLASVFGMTAFLSPPITFAETSYYAGASISRVEYEVSNTALDAEWDLTALGARLGVQFHQNLSAELRLGLGLGDDETNEVEIELEHYIGGYMRAGMSLGRAYPYLIAGYTDAEIKVTAGAISADSDDSDFSYGIGIDIQASDANGFNLEWMKYYDKNSTEISAFQIGFVHTF